MSNSDSPQKSLKRYMSSLAAWVRGVAEESVHGLQKDVEPYAGAGKGIPEGMFPQAAAASAQEAGARTAPQSHAENGGGPAASLKL